jgi:hypothetical protein
LQAVHVSGQGAHQRDLAEVGAIDLYPQARAVPAETDLVGALVGAATLLHRRKAKRHGRNRCSNRRLCLRNRPSTHLSRSHLVRVLRVADVRVQVGRDRVGDRIGLRDRVDIQLPRRDLVRVLKVVHVRGELRLNPVGHALKLRDRQIDVLIDDVVRSLVADLDRVPNAVKSVHHVFETVHVTDVVQVLRRRKLTGLANDVAPCYRAVVQSQRIDHLDDGLRARAVRAAEGLVVDGDVVGDGRIGNDDDRIDFLTIPLRRQLVVLAAVILLGCTICAVGKL